MSRLFSSILAATAAFASIAFAACSTDRDGFTGSEPPPFETPDAGDAAASPQCGFRCSRDLKKVLEGCGLEEERVVAECPVGKGCGVDTCVDACTSAALSKGSVGCSFWTLPPDDVDFGAGGCFAALIANTWDVPVNLTAEYGPDPIDISQSIYTVATPNPHAGPVYARLSGPLPPGDVAVVFLAHAEVRAGTATPLCPKGTVPALKTDPIRHGTTRTKAFHLKADAPISAYSIFPYGGAASELPASTLLLPVSSWDTGYFAVSTAKFGESTTSKLDRRTLQIVSNEDDTKVSMRPTVDISQGDGVAPAVAGEVVEWTLSKGEVLQITQNRSTSGSPIAASKPVGVFGGSPCAFLPVAVNWCDLTHQQIAPFAQWGTSYALVPFLPRISAVTGAPRETVPWSFVGAVDGTVLTYDPVKPPGAPETLSAGEVATFQTDAIVTVKSQDAKHPFHAAVYMTGAENGGGSPFGGRTLGDPEFVNVVPSEQFLDRYVFFTDFTFPETSLTLVRRKTAAGFAPVRLECAGEVGGWKPLDASGEFEFTWVRLTSGGIPQRFDGGPCGYGRHEASSDGPFAVYVWGIGKDASYGYAGGMGARPINDAPPPVVQ
ncbi:MAG: IgGFc-binding protein [Myxococcales bacterium]|nr:IgGFc-binding protein [Myxococcales bacterium]